MESAPEPLLCFPRLNASCHRLAPASSTALLAALLAAASLLTVALNALVIASVARFRRLRTPTNTLLLSLAACDLLVGLLVMPVEGLRYVETCWLLGRLACALTPYLSYCLLSASVGHMVLISVDRYLAVCGPLLYPARVTQGRVRTAVCACWACSLLYNGCILTGHLARPGRAGSCHGECVVVVSPASGAADLFVTFVGPCVVMAALYLRVVAAAVSQARVSRLAATLTVKKSEWKAAKTLGIVVAVFLMCFCPYYYPAVAGEDTSTGLSYFAVLSWIMMLNSCLNPLIYALFYAWFRRAIKLMFTLRTPPAGSRRRLQAGRGGGPRVQPFK